MAEKKTQVRPRLSPRLMMIVGGVVALVLMAVFGLPWMMRQFPAASATTDAPAATVTPTTASTIAPTSTVALLPSSATLEPPSILTRTAPPSVTPTPAPAWVKDFAEPILADIRSREPDIQDNFDWNTTFWAPGDWCASRVRVTNGVMKMTDCHVHFTRNYDNFVAAFDLSFPGMNDGNFKFYMRESSSFAGCDFGFQANGGVYWDCSNPYHVLRNLTDNMTAIKHILVIVQGNQVALFLNERAIEMMQLDILKYGNSYLSGSGQIDNFKLWQISNSSEIPQPTEQFKPQTTASPATACDSFQFVADVTVPDGTVFLPNTPFIKTWRIKNVGTCTWDSSYVLIFNGGAQLDGPDVLPLPASIPPGKEIDISIKLQAPAEEGDFRGYWALRNPSGFVFFAEDSNNSMYVEIRVVKPTQTPSTPAP
jgi:hypothetical protein